MKKTKFFIETLDASGERWVRLCEKYWDDMWRFRELSFLSMEQAMERVYEEDDLCRILEIKYHFITFNKQSREIQNG